MSTQTVEGFIVHEQYDWESAGRFTFLTYTPSAEYSPDKVVVCPYTVEIEVPDSFDPRPGKLKALEAQREALQREFSEKVLQINQQIANLQAITYEPAKVEA